MTVGTGRGGVEELMGAGQVSDARGRIVAPGVRDLDETAAVLTPWLAQRLPEAGSDLRLSGLTYPRGSGQSAETILFDAHWSQDGADVTRGLVARLKPVEFLLFGDDMFVEQFEVMRVIGERGDVPVARVLWREDDPAVLGSPFFVMDKLAGRVAVSLPSYLDEGWVAEATVEQRSRLWENCVRALASVASVPPEAVPFLALPGGDTGFEQEWARWDRFLAQLTRPDRPLAGHHDLQRRLRAALPSHREDGLVWGDARIGNMMIDDDFSVVALMDWEQPSLGGALQDLGWWLINQRNKVDVRPGGLLPGMLTREDTIALWGGITGIPTGDVDWYESFAAFKMACLMINLLDLRGQPAERAGDLHIAAGLRLLEG